MQRWQEMLARAGIRTPFGRDAVGAVLVLFFDVGYSLLLYTSAEVAQRAPALAFGLKVLLMAIAAGSLAWRRQAPRAVLAAVVAATLVNILVYAEPSAARSFLAFLVAAYTVGAYCRRHSALTALGVAVAVAPLWGLVLLALPALPFGAELPDPSRLLIFSSVQAVLIMALPGLFGAFVVGQREQRARQAVIEDRARIARELHDVAAHHLSGIAVQAGAAERQAHRDPEAVQRALADIHEQASATLTQMRGLIGGLRDDGQDSAAGQLPGLARAGRLVDEARRAGCDVALSVAGQSTQTLPPAADFAGYRVLQESLSNARRHAPGAPVTARVSYDTDTVEVEVANPGPPEDSAVPAEAGNGQGLAGMRERVALAGGTLAAGPTAEGGWRVHAALPTTNGHHPEAVQPASTQVAQ